MIGCVLVSLNGAVVLTGRGLLFGLGSGLGYALYSIFGRLAIEKGYHSFTIIFYTFVFASLATAPLADVGQLAICFSGGSYIGMTLFFALVSTVFPYILYTSGLTGVMPSVASIVSTIEPVTATALGLLFFKEALTAGSVAGILVVIAGVILLNVGPGKDGKETYEEKSSCG